MDETALPYAHLTAFRLVPRSSLNDQHKTTPGR